MQQKTNKSNPVENTEKEKDSTKFTYPASEDIYRNEEIDSEIDPDDTTKHKSPNQDPDIMNEKDFSDDMSGNDLDIPGAELDDAQEKIGSEDEENNYYSIGGDNHNDLEEDNG